MRVADNGAPGGQVIGTGDDLQEGQREQDDQQRHEVDHQGSRRRGRAWPAVCTYGGGDAHFVTSSRCSGLGAPQLLRDSLLLEADAVPAHELVGDHDREHDDALGDRHDVRGDADQDLQGVGLLVEVGEQQGAQGDADRVVAPEQGDRDAGEAQPGLERRAVDVRVPEEDRQADQAGDRSGEQHRGHGSSA